MDELKNKTFTENRTLAPLTVAASSKFLLESLGATAVGTSVISSPLLLGTLLAAGAFYIGKLIDNHQGATVIHINNLVINLNAEMVQQLNMNPKEVINQLKDQIQQTSLKAIPPK